MMPIVVLAFIALAVTGVLLTVRKKVRSTFPLCREDLPCDVLPALDNEPEAGCDWETMSNSPDAQAQSGSLPVAPTEPEPVPEPAVSTDPEVRPGTVAGG